jgi:hypothetical protein
MDTDAQPAEMNSTETWKDRVARKINKAWDSAMLEEIEASVLKLDPVLNRKGREVRLGVLLTAAAVVGPDVDRLIAFTHYSWKFVEAVSFRMRAAGRWTDTAVRTDHWFDGDAFLPGGFWLDCLVADGAVELARTDDGEEQFRSIVPPK